MTTSWETITTSFLRSDKPYGGGAFRIRGNQVISLKVADPVITFKPASEAKNPDVAEPTEPWMNDTAETLNRNTVSFLHGSLNGSLTRTFQHRGQNAAWWYSSDWRTLYISTAWMDYKGPKSANGYLPQTTKLWRSGDGGQTWAQLSWPDDRDIEQLMFLDAQRGYAIGWGPRVWRTADGGQSWHGIEVPEAARFAGKPRKTFDAVNLGPDGVLRVAYCVDRSEGVEASSHVDRIGWEQSRFEQDIVLPKQRVVDLQSAPGPTPAYSLYALSKVGRPYNVDDASDNGRRPGALSVWGSAEKSAVQQLRAFDERLMLDGLSVGRHGVLLVYATQVPSHGAPVDLTFLSRTFGKSWHDLDTGAAQGGYFDPDTNTQYALFAYTLKKRRL